MTEKPRVVIKIRKLSYEHVKSLFESSGCTLVSEEYINNFTKLDYICSCGNLAKITLKDFKKGNRCAACKGEKISKALRHDAEDVINYFRDNGCELLSHYVDANTPLDYICSCGRKAKIAYKHFQNGVRCKKCASEKNSGENHPFWNPELTDEERLKRRDVKEYTQWSQRVKERDNFTCQSCGQVGYSLESHHLYGWNKYKELRFEISNGVTLCKTCHIDFHSKYGKKDNTREQYYEWLALNEIGNRLTSNGDCANDHELITNR